MNIGIVGSEAAKFTPITEATAKDIIDMLIHDVVVAGEMPYVVSGECHLGGIDIWAKEAALDSNVGYIGCPPAKLTWEGGYKQRNLKIARESDMVSCITLRELPPTYNGMKFTHCYHCKVNDHVKSGGCWTVKQAVKMGKIGRIFIVNPDGTYEERPFI